VSSRAREGEPYSLFWLYQIQHLAQDLFLQRVFAEPPLQFANLMLQRPEFGGRHYLLASTYARQRAVGVKPAPREQLVRRDPVPTPGA
jgi:hypothetical protein